MIGHAALCLGGVVTHEKDFAHIYFGFISVTIIGMSKQ
jgi:hypothetical protein